MIERQLRCSSVLSAAGWIGPALLRLDTEGFISAVESLPENAAVDYGPIIPGMPNLHSHAFQRQMAGLSGLPGNNGDSFWSWRELMYSLAQRIRPDQLLAIAAFLQLEMLENGYTSCAEFHYLHHQPGGRPYDNPAELSAQILAAAEMSGIALTLLPVLYCRSGFASEDVNQRQLRFRCSADQYLELWSRCLAMTQGQPLQRCGLAPHSLRAVAAQQLNEVLDACKNVDQPIHIHIAEQVGEVDECVAVLGARPVQWLLANQQVNERWCLVHATHMDAKEISAALHSQSVIGLCPSTEADLGDGFFPIENWFNQLGSFGIGSDSNLRLAPSEELRMLEFQARLQSGKRNVLTENGHSVGRSLYQRALTGGAQALGQKAGRIEPGYRADLVELDKEHLLLAGRSEDVLLDSWILAGDQSMLRSVWVGGRQQVAKGQHIAREKLQPAFRKAMLELL
ncbi:MAG: formimidoylglutamate deiminase [Xanthomonadales bacterium]|nr:formimidoylglutamate deiminase [Xanthomonadales bacterium]